IFLILTLLIPITWIIFSSLLPQRIFTGGYSDITDFLSLTIGNYINYTKHIWVFSYISNSILIIALSSILTIFISSMLAFGMKRLEVVVQKVMLIFIIPGMIIPFQFIASPLSQLLGKTSLSDTNIGIILT